ncbi:hypothetical protein KCP74_16145 [Salmonella enterica subsp. enterica]|nr:hypothetical protein KCP74_16145 [Salmonella enterica subsp. enterica]
MTGCAVGRLTRRQQKRSGNDLPLLECLSTPFRLNSLLDLRSSSSCSHTGSISGKFTSLLRGWRLA